MNVEWGREYKFVCSDVILSGADFDALTDAKITLYQVKTKDQRADDLLDGQGSLGFEPFYSPYYTTLQAS